MKKLLKIGILAFGISLFIISCSKEETTEIELTEIQFLQSNFSLENFSDDFIKNNLKIDWSNFSTYQDKETNNFSYEFNASFNINNSIENGKQKLGVNYKLLAFKNDLNNWTFELIKFLSNNAKNINNISYFSTNDFSGTLYHYNLNGQNIKIKAYKKGILINEFSDNGNVIDAQLKAPATYCDDGCYVLVITERYTDWYHDIGGGFFVYTHSVLTNITSEWVWVYGNGGGGGSTYHQHFDNPHGPSGGTYNHNNENIADNLDDVPPSCESFNYTRIGATNWQTAAVSNIHELFTIINWECIGYDWGIFTQPLYFQLPINTTYSLDSGATKIESAAYLHSAFNAFNVWYQQNGCNSGGAALEQKLLEYIKDEFEEHGGNVTLTPPNGFNGTITSYKITWVGYGNCN